MNRNLTTLLFTLLLGGSVLAQENTFEIRGGITGTDASWIYLKYLDKNDSARIENGLFKFKGSVPHVVDAILHLNKRGLAENLYFGNETTEARLAVNGGSLEFKEIRSATMTMVQEVPEKAMGIIENNEDFNAPLYAMLEELVSENPRNQFVSEFIGDVMSEPGFLTLEQSRWLFSLMDKSTVDPDYLEDMKITMKRMENIKVGDDLPDFTLTDLDGQPRGPRDFKGKLLLIDFWSTSCGWCRVANKELVEMYEVYRSKGFEILSVSLDKKEATWRNSVTQDGLTWTNVRAPEGFKQDIAVKLGVVYLPYNYLVDGDGKILAIEPSLDAVRKVLEGI